MTEAAHEIIKQAIHHPFMIGDTIKYSGKYIDTVVGPVLKVRVSGGLEIPDPTDPTRRMVATPSQSEIICPAGGWIGAWVQCRSDGQFLEIIDSSGAKDNFHELYGMTTLRHHILQRGDYVLHQRSGRSLRELQTLAMARGHI